MLTSLKNPKVAAVARLRKDAARERERSFLVEGAQGISEALEREPPGVVALLVADPLDPLAVRASQRGVDVSHASQDVLRKLTSTVTPQGIVGVAPYLDVDLSAVPHSDPSCVTRTPAPEISSSTPCAVNVPTKLILRVRALMFGNPPGPRTRPSNAWTLTLPCASTSANERLATSSPPPS